MKPLTQTTIVSLCALICLAGCSLAPKPLNEDQLAHIAHIDREATFEGQEEIEGELTLELAMSLALKYNLENRVRLLEETVASQQIKLTKSELLPSLAVSAGYLDRNEVNASRSVSVSSGQESLEPSTSQENEQLSANGRFAWNLLDFGVSYLQAKQDADRFLIAQKAREKVMLTLLKEVRAAYWQAVAMEQMRDELDGITIKVEELLDYWQSVREERLRPPVAVLMDIRALIETRQQLDDIRRAIDTANARLANLINAKDFQSLKLPKTQSFPELVDVSDDIEALELIALSNSADYSSEIYKVRIDQLETRKAMLRLLPGLEFSYGENYNDNSFLLNQRWGELGLNLTGDLTQLFFVKQLKKFRETNEQLTVGRKLAINMAVVTNVHITWQDYRNALTQLDRARYLQEIDEQISLLTRNAEVNLKEAGAAAIQTELRAFRSKISQMQSYADAQEAYGSFVVSLGVNPIPQDYNDRSVVDLADEVASRLDVKMFPYTKKGEALLAERKKMDEWVEERDRQLALEEQRALEAERVREAERVATELARIEAAKVRAENTRLAAEKQAQSEAEEQLLATQQTAPAEKKTAESGDRAIASTTPPEPVEMATVAPDPTEFLTHFWLKYFPKPDRTTYLQQFADNLPEGPSKNSYPNLFLKNLPSGPDKEVYLEKFLEQPGSSPDASRYVDEFRTLVEPASEG